MKTVEIIITGKNSGVELGTFLACVDVDGSLTVPYEIIARRCPELNNNILWVDGELLGDPLEDVIDMVVWGEHEALGSVPVRVIREVDEEYICERNTYDWILLKDFRLANISPENGGVRGLEARTRPKSEFTNQKWVKGVIKEYTPGGILKIFNKFTARNYLRDPGDEVWYHT